MPRLGKTGPETSRIGLGCMGMSDYYGPADEATSIRTIHHAVERGVNLLDTADFYGMGHNEMLIGRALRQIDRKKVVLSVKFGALRTPDGAFSGFDGRPEAVKNFVAYSLRRLGTDYIDIYRPARLDPQVPIEETVGAIKDLIDAGHVRHLGLSEMGPDTIRRAHAVTPVADLQIEYSLMSRTVEHAILPTLRELGIGMTAYGVLSRGLIADVRREVPDGLRERMPRFQRDNFERNRVLVDRLGKLARERGVSTSQLALAWVAAQGENIVPLIGTTKPDRLEEALAALGIELSPADLSEIAETLPADRVVGTRYDAHQMEMLDSERG